MDAFIYDLGWEEIWSLLLGTSSKFKDLTWEMLQLPSNKPSYIFGDQKMTMIMSWVYGHSGFTPSQTLGGSIYYITFVILTLTREL